MTSLRWKVAFALAIGLHVAGAIPTPAREGRATAPTAQEQEPLRLLESVPRSRVATSILQTLPAGSRVVRVATDQLLDAALRKRDLELDLLPEVSLVATFARVEIRATDDFTWIGSIGTAPASYVLISVKRTAFVADVFIDGRFFTLLSISGDLATVQEVKPDDYPPVDPSGVPGYRLALPRLRVSPGRDSGKEIVVLVVYTPAARRRANGRDSLESAIRNGTTQMNIALRNSEAIPEVRVAAIEEVQYVESGLALTDLRFLSADGDGVMDDVHVLRDDHAADLVQLVIGKPTREDGQELCGRALGIMTGLDIAFASKAFSLAKYECLGGPTFAFAHELGHIMGLQHSRTDPINPKLGAFTYSYGYKKSVANGFSTIMAYNDCRLLGLSCPNILHFSNPDVVFAGVPTGIPIGRLDAAHNTLSINRARKTIANFRTSAPTETLPQPVEADPGGGTYSTTIQIALRSTEATSIYYTIETTTNGTEPSDPPRPNNQSVHGQLDGPSNTLPLGESGALLKAKLVFRGKNQFGFGKASDVHAYTIDLRSSSERPGAVSVVPGTNSWTSAPQYVDVSSDNASRIYFTIRATTNGSEPEDPPVPKRTRSGHDGSLGGSSRPFKVRGSNDDLRRIKVRFRGDNDIGYGPPTGVHYYEIDLRPLGPAPNSVSVDPPSGSWTDASHYVDVTSDNSSRIYYTFRSTSDGSEPDDPLIPSASTNNGMFTGSSGQYPVTGIDNALRRVKVRFRGHNDAGYGPSTDPHSYQIDLRTTACSYSISPTQESFGSAGGAGSISVSTSSTCTWSASSNVPWISITSGSNETGNGTVSYEVDGNSGASSRTGTITVEGNTFTVTQDGASCTYSISPTSESFSEQGGSGSITVTTSSGCDWSASSNDSWMSITAGSIGTGEGTVSYQVDANADPSSRTGTLTVAGEPHTVDQSGKEATLGDVRITATRDGANWEGSVDFNITGPTGTIGRDSVPVLLSDVPTGTYAVEYRGGGPESASFDSYVPSPSQTLDADQEITFTLAFASMPLGAFELSVDGSCSGDVPEHSLQWTEASGATAYTVHIDGDTRAVGSATSYVHSDLSSGVEYTYFVRSNDNTGQTKDSNTVKTVAPYCTGFNFDLFAPDGVRHTGTELTYTSTIYGGQPPFDYEWGGEASGTGTLNVTSFDADGPSTTLTYATPGSKTVSLKMTDNNGVEETRSVEIEVVDPPPATATIHVVGSRDGTDWSGDASYRIIGKDTGHIIIGTYIDPPPDGTVHAGVPPDQYTIEVLSGPDSGWVITPGDGTTLEGGDIGWFYVDFRTKLPDLEDYNFIDAGGGWDGPLIVSTEPGNHTLTYSVPVNADLYVDFALRNYPFGQVAATAAPFDVHLLIDGTVIQGWTIPAGFAPGDVFFREDIVIKFTDPGTYRVEFVIDPDNKIQELKEWNNGWFENITAS